MDVGPVYLDSDRARISTSQAEITRVQSQNQFHHVHKDTDYLAVEEPLEIRIEYGALRARVRRSLSITMRTPGHDSELAVGFMLTEGIIQSPQQILKTEFQGSQIGTERNIVKVDLAPDVTVDMKRLERHFYTSSSCGVCGKSSIEALVSQSPPYWNNQNFKAGLKIDALTVQKLPKLLREHQSLFDKTGGLHACATFDSEGNILCVREDVGRHNALDKLIGSYFLRAALPLSDKILLVSGRASFELIQKSAMAGIQVFAAVGAPSSLAVELARECEMTLIGFLRDERFNIYAGAQRVIT